MSKVVPKTSQTDAGSEQVLRSLIPEEDWICESVFRVETDAVGTYPGLPRWIWLVDLQNAYHIFNVTGKPEVTDDGLCYCYRCHVMREQWLPYTPDKPGTWLRFGPYIGHVAQRGMLLQAFPGHRAERHQWARAITIALMLQTDPKAVHQMACG